MLHLFQNVVRQHKDKLAVVDANSFLSYEMLDRVSDNMAFRLLKHIGTDTEIVAVFIESSAEALTAILSILKSGCAYLPIDPGYSTSYVNDILSEADVSIVITTKKHSHRLNESEAHQVLLLENKNDNAGKPKNLH